MTKTISYRVTDYELNQIEDLKNWLQTTWTEAGINKKVTTSDVIFQALINDWQRKCLPLKSNKTTGEK